MSVFSGPEIVNDGLIMNLDAANARSYPGSGTVWYDLTGNEKNGTLQGSPTYNAENRGGFVFSGANYVLSSNSYTTNPLPTGTASRTIVACFRPTALANPYAHVMHYGSEGTDQSYGVTLFSNGGSYYVANHTWAGTSYFTNYAVQPNQTYWVAITYNNSASPRNTIFVNGTFGTIGYGQGKTADYAINTGSAYQLNLGTRINPLEYFTGTIYFGQVYNRALSAAEIAQNFEAYRGRYGI